MFQESSSKSEDDWLTLTVRWRHLFFAGVFFVCGQAFLSANYRLSGRAFSKDYRINDKIRTYVLPWKGRGTACGGGFDVVANYWKPCKRSLVRQTHHHASHGPPPLLKADISSIYYTNSINPGSKTPRQTVICNIFTLEFPFMFQSKCCIA